jgi:hypothetical protein
MKLARVMAVLMIGAGCGCSSDLTEDELVKIASQEPGPPAQFWTSIANDNEQSALVQIVAIQCLFKRHVVKGMTLTELAKVLDNPQWIDRGRVTRVTIFKGFTTFENQPPGSSIIRIVVFFSTDPKANGNGFGLMLLIDGEIGREDFISTVLDGQPTKYQGLKILDWRCPNYLPSTTEAEYVRNTRPN